MSNRKKVRKFYGYDYWIIVFVKNYNKIFLEIFLNRKSIHTFVQNPQLVLNSEAKISQLEAEKWALTISGNNDRYQFHQNRWGMTQKNPGNPDTALPLPHPKLNANLNDLQILFCRKIDGGFEEKTLWLNLYSLPVKII